jgi:hypothetical protein
MSISLTFGNIPGARFSRHLGRPGRRREMPIPLRIDLLPAVEGPFVNRRGCAEVAPTATGADQELVRENRRRLPARKPAGFGLIFAC